MQIATRGTTISNTLRFKPRLFNSENSLPTETMSNSYRLWVDLAGLISYESKYLLTALVRLRPIRRGIADEDQPRYDEAI